MGSAFDVPRKYNEYLYGSFICVCPDHSMKESLVGTIIQLLQLFWVVPWRGGKECSLPEAAVGGGGGGGGGGGKGNTATQ